MIGLLSKTLPMLTKVSQLASKLPKGLGARGSRMIGSGFNNVFGGMGAGEKFWRFGPDALGGIVSAASLPANASLGDRLLTGTIDTVLPATLGLGASRLPGVRGNPHLAAGFDTVGSYAGAYAAMPISDQGMRLSNQMFGTGENKNPWERLSEQQWKEEQARIRQEILLGYGLIPGTRPQEMLYPGMQNYGEYIG